jgi:membrane protease YdiL (CAAX protease family)
MSLAPEERKTVISYVLAVFVLTWGLDVVVYLQGGLANARMFQILVGAQMLIPALVAVTFRAFRREGFKGTGLCLGKKRYYLVSFGVIAAFLGLSFGLSALTPWLTLDRDLGKFQALIATLTAQTGQASPLSVEAIAALMALQVWVIGALLGIPAYWGEEYGWRGYLLPKLMGLGQVRAIALHGVIWGLWHAPIIAMGYNYPAYPAAGILWMTVFTVLMGAILAWLYYASGSIFVPALAHGFLNQGAAYGFMFVAGYQALLGGPLGLVGLSVLAAIVWGLYRRQAFDVVGRPLC